MRNTKDGYPKKLKNGRKDEANSYVRNKRFTEKSRKISIGTH